MKMPGFHAEASLQRSTKTYRSSGHYRQGQSVDSHAGTLVPAVPFQMTTPAALRLPRVSGRSKGCPDCPDCDGCPPDHMDGSTLYCLIRCDEHDCEYAPCGYV